VYNQALPRGDETVLLVEDEETVRHIAVRALRELGYTVLEAANGVEALRVAEAHLPEPVHLLVTDVVMPHLGGKELFDQLAPRFPGLRVIFVSGYTNDDRIYPQA